MDKTKLRIYEVKSSSRVLRSNRRSLYNHKRSSNHAVGKTICIKVYQMATNNEISFSIVQIYFYCGTENLNEGVHTKDLRPECTQLMRSPSKSSGNILIHKNMIKRT